MSLDNIQLQPFVIQELFKKSLINSKIEQISSISSEEQKIDFLGENEKKIVILINDENYLYLADIELNFLIGILTACKLNLNDVAIVNLNKHLSIDYLFLQQYFSATKVLAFGISLDNIQLPLQFPLYQTQFYNEVIYMHAPALQLLKDNKEEKAKLWASLQKIFLT